MVSVTKQVLQKVQKLLPMTRLCKKLLVVTPVEHVVRGFMFERSIMPGMYYFWSVIGPLYTPRPYLILDYGDRLESGETFNVTAETIESTSDRILDVIVNGPLGDLERIGDPKNFLGHLNKLLPGRRDKADLALTHYMLGYPKECARVLERAVEELRPYESRADWIGELSIFLDELKNESALPARLIEKWERASIENLGLAKAMGNCTAQSGQ